MKVIEVVVYLGGSQDYIVWSSEEFTDVEVLTNGIVLRLKNKGRVVTYHNVAYSIVRDPS